MIKRFLIIVYLGFFSLLLTAQAGDLVKENRIWAHLLQTCEPDITYYTTFYQRFEGDTIIDNKSYLKVMLADDELASAWFHTGEFAREENGRVFYLSDPEEREVMIYDFNIKVGEQVEVWNPIASDEITLTVNKIDSVMTLDGFRKRWELVLDIFSPPEIWIEGVGSESGILNSGTGIYLGICGTYSLLCSSDLGNQVYQNPSYESCYYNLLDDGNSNLAEAENINILYQAGTKTILINGSASNQIMVTNISGVVLYKGEMISDEASINTTNYRPGLHVITIIGLGTVVSKKIMIR